MKRTYLVWKRGSCLVARWSLLAPVVWLWAALPCPHSLAPLRTETQPPACHLPGGKVHLLLKKKILFTKSNNSNFLLIDIVKAIYFLQNHLKILWMIRMNIYCTSQCFNSNICRTYASFIKRQTDILDRMRSQHVYRYIGTGKENILFCAFTDFHHWGCKYRI